MGLEGGLERLEVPGMARRAGLGLLWGQPATGTKFKKSRGYILAMEYGLARKFWASVQE